MPDPALLEAVRQAAAHASALEREYRAAVAQTKAAVIAAATAPRPHARGAIARAAGVSRQRIDQILRAPARREPSEPPPGMFSSETTGMRSLLS